MLKNLLGGGAGGKNEEPPASVLAAWNSYSGTGAGPSTSGSSFDVEAGLNKLTSTLENTFTSAGTSLTTGFSTVSKGVQDGAAATAKTVQKYV